MGAFHYDKDADGIVTVTMDMDGPVNAMNADFTPLLKGTVDRLAAEAGLAGVVITSAKDTFFAGGDLKWLSTIEPGQEAELFDYVEALKADLRRLEKLGVPVVAAINGTAAGGGFEIALACHRRIAVDDARLRVGLPEVTLGLLPGGGGVVRMTWMLGMEAALPHLTEGRMLAPAAALKAGLIQDLVPSRDDLLPAAKNWILSVRGDADAAVQPWDRKGYRIPGGPSNAPAMAPRIAGAAASIFKKTRGLLPAPERIFDIMAEAAGRMDFDSALRYESRRFAALVPTVEAKNMIATFFFGMNKVNGGGSRPKGFDKSSVTRLGIVGAGMMGQGIAYCAAIAGIAVVLKDVSLEAAEKGKAYSAGLLDKQVERGRMSPEAREAVLARITPAAEAAALAGCDLIVEAVFERLDVKEAVRAEHESLLAEGGIWASNTSTLPIGRLAEHAADPESFIGLHFFSPVDKMPLLEIVVGDKTSERTLARAFDFARQIGKTPIVVKDGAGFYTSRTILTTLEESAQMVAEGIDPALIEGLSRSLGYPVGMLTLFDEVKLSLALDIHDTQVKMGLRDPAADTIAQGRAFLRDMVEKNGRGGRGHGGGFFDYGGGKALWPNLASWRKAEVAIPHDDIRDRILFRAVIETWRCLEEGVLHSIEDANVGSILGIGAPAWTGGYAQFVETYGRERFVARCRDLSARYGARFAPPAILTTHAAA